METDSNIYDCPHCESENTRKLSLIHKDGISRTRGTVSTTKSFGNFSSSSQTSASYNAAPPKDLGLFLVQKIMIGVLLWLASVFIMVNYVIPIIDSILKAIFLGFLLGPVHLLEVGATFTVVPLLIVTITIVKPYTAYAKEYPLLRKNWDKTYQCQRCEKQFIISN